ncbi:MAG: PIN domain-containing protein [Candidatus Binataceae bacterium]
MKNAEPSYYVVLDANVWVAERLLRSSIGSALLLGLTSSRALLGLPEVVEMEVNRVFAQQAAQAIEAFRKNVNFLRQLSGQHSLHEIPTPQAIEEGLQHRWNELAGLLERRPFSFEVAKAALQRVIENMPPSGQNNEQFRDCCLWEASVSLAVDRPVHFVSNDSAFYENRDRNKGLVEPLRKEAESAGREIFIYPTIRDLLARIDRPVAVVDESAIAAAIVSAATPKARELAAIHAALHQLEGDPQTQIKGYATPKQSLVAVSFDVMFTLKSIEPIERAGDRSPAWLRVGGTCSYDPITGNVCDIEIGDYTVRTGNGAYGTGQISYLGEPARTEYV